MRDKYATFMVEKKFVLEYLSLLIKQNNKIQKGLLIFVALMSSSVIGGWMIWNTVSPLWAVFLAISNVINIIRPYLPYDKRAKVLYQLDFELSTQFIYIEKEWNDIEEGKIDDSAINEKYANFDLQWTNSMNKFMADDSFPDDKKMTKRADEETNTYFKKFYGGIVVNG
jgi:hypothetical protein